MTNATASVSNTIATIAAATEAYLGYIDMIFGSEDETIATESTKGDKNLAKTKKNYEANGKNAEDAKVDLATKSIDKGNMTYAGKTTITKMKKKTIGESLGDILKAIKEFFLSLFGQKVPETAVVPVLHTQPKIDDMLNEIEDAYVAMTRANTTEEWDAAFEKFKEQVQNFGSRLATCRKELGGLKENYKQMRKEKVAPKSQLRKLESMNKQDFKDVANLEAIHKELAKVYQNLAAYYENKTVKKFLCFGKKELTADDLKKKTTGRLGYTDAVTKGNIREAHKTITKNSRMHDNYDKNYGTTD